MILTKLFETQRKFRERVNYQGSDRLEKLILALMVELGECANEWRGFKFWSKDQQPRTKVYYGPPEMPDVGTYENPLLEEYVDGLHFVLEIGLEQEGRAKHRIYDKELTESITEQFHYIYTIIEHLKYNPLEFGGEYRFDDYIELMGAYLGLGEMFGFTWEQIEEAYYAKNAVNHQRQEEGY